MDEFLEKESSRDTIAFSMARFKPYRPKPRRLKVSDILMVAVAVLMIVDAVSPHPYGVRKRWGGTEYNPAAIHFLMTIQVITGVSIIGLVAFARLYRKGN